MYREWPMSSVALSERQRGKRCGEICRLVGQCIVLWNQGSNWSCHIKKVSGIFSRRWVGSSNNGGDQWMGPRPLSSLSRLSTLPRSRALALAVGARTTYTSNTIRIYKVPRQTARYRDTTYQVGMYAVLYTISPHSFLASLPASVPWFL